MSAIDDTLEAIAVRTRQEVEAQAERNMRTLRHLVAQGLNNAGVPFDEAARAFCDSYREAVIQAVAEHRLDAMLKKEL